MSSDPKVEFGCNRNRSRRDNHDRLFFAAIEEFERVGYDRARIERICQRSEVTRPTFYAHFSNKEGVLSELHLRHFEHFTAELHKRTSRPLDLDGVIEALILACFETSGVLSEELRRQILSYLPRFQRLSEWEDTEPFAILVHSFEKARQRKEIAGHDPRELARDVVSIINGFLIADASNLESGAQGARRALGLFLAGLRATAHAQSVQPRARGAA